MMTSMQIISLHAENIKRLKAVRIAPTGAVTIIGGRNAQGKTSVLDAIEMALGGKACKRPVHNGAEVGVTSLELDELDITRTFDKDGKSSLVIRDKNGRKRSAPHELLGKLVGDLSFDPLAFSRMKDAAQLEQLRQLVKIDFTSLDEQKAKLKEERSLVSKEGTELKARMEAMPDHRDVPAAEISVADLANELQRLNAINQENTANRRLADSSKADVDKQVVVVRASQEAISATERTIKDLERRLAEERAKLDKQQQDHQAADSKLAELKQIAQERSTTAAALVDADVAPISTQLTQVEDTNRKVRENAEKQTMAGKIIGLQTKYRDLTTQMVAIDETKHKLVADAQFPVPGLSFDDEGVTYNNVPFSQASEAEKLRVSVAMHLAMQPKLKVVLIRDGSLLDSDNLAIITGEAEKAGAQVWIERVGTNDPTAVVIEDGEVASAPAAAS